MEKRKITVLLIQGLVQGVGFRPFIYRIASEMGVKGEVDNRNEGVCIRASLSAEQLPVFIQRIYEEHPPVAYIHRIIRQEEERSEAAYTSFTITPSHSDSDEVTQVSPDIAVCPACLHDRQTQPHRLGYPFINCTHCGPRFSIIRNLPYDRSQTTMSRFPLCPDCQKEYRDVADRRFHAQPVACNRCGPSYSALYNKVRYTDYKELLALSSSLIKSGEVIAAKGIGGYHLVCDAANEPAVDRLREIKQRESKPFAVMFRDLETVKQYAKVSLAEENSLISWRRPIVLLQIGRENDRLASGVHPGMQTIGAMLPYMPIHEDWFRETGLPALVMTSGNLSDLPIAISEEEANRQLAGRVPLILHHDREIYNRVDDSVLQVCGSQPCLIRRSRGYVPEPFFADLPVEGILAFGAEKVNTFALGKGETILQSQYIGDLKNWETYQFYTESLERFRHLFRFHPVRLVCDLHPDYLSSREAVRMSTEQQLPLLYVQHHHAHAAACLLEHQLDEPVIALVMDGTGMGDDGKVWGGEFFLCDRKRYTRLSHLEYIPLPGGDKASVEPWRMAIAYFWHYNRTCSPSLPLPSDLVGRVGGDPIRLLQKMMEKGINTTQTSSCGRLFDAVASLLGVCDRATRQAEAPVLLEQLAVQAGYQEPYPFVDEYPLEEKSFSLYPLWLALSTDKEKGVSAAVLAARFHSTLAFLLFRKACYLLQQQKVDKVVASGGCFQNRLLTEQLQQLFGKAGIPFYIPGRIPCNDSGISVGQLTIAASSTFINI